MRLVRYLLDPKNTQERVGRATVTNCHSNEPMVAALEAEAVQRLNQRSNDEKTYHFLFSFREGERPSPEVLRDCELEFCRVLGFAEHQRVSVVHHDTNNLHVHVAVNKIHPTRLTIHTPFNDYWVRTQAAERLEIKHNLARDRHERRDPEEGPIGPAADMERHSGNESFARWVQREAADDLCRAATWAELHRAARIHGLDIRLRGNGAVITQGDRVVRASSVRRELSLKAMQKRLGAFEPASTQEATAHDRGATKPHAQSQLPRLPSGSPPPHLRGKQASLSAIVDERVHDANYADPAEGSEGRHGTEELKQRSEDWSRLIAELVRADRSEPHARAGHRESRSTAEGVERARGALSDRPPPPHIRSNLGRWNAAPSSASSEATAVPSRPSKEELQRRAEDWSRLIAELSRTARSKSGPRVQAARATLDERRRSYTKRPMVESPEGGKLYELYLRDRVQRDALRRERRSELRRDHQAAFERVIQRWRLTRTALRLVSGTRGEKRFMYAAARLAMQQELKALRAQSATKRRVLAQATKRMAWADWLQARARAGSAAALVTLRRRRQAPQTSSQAQRAITGACLSTSAQPADGIIDTVTKTGVVVYRGALTGVRDDGHQLRVQGRVSDSVLAEALRVAANRYGSALRVDGDEAFKHAVVDVAVAHNMDVTFDDANLEARRRTQQQEETDLGRRAKSGRDDGRSERKQQGPTHLEAAAERQTPDRKDGLRNLRVGELVRDREWAQRLLSPHVSADVASGAQQDRETLRRPARVAQQINGAPPPFRRGRLRPLSMLGTASGPTNSERRQTRAPLKRAKGKGQANPRPIAPRTTIPTLGSNEASNAASKSTFDGRRNTASARAELALSQHTRSSVDAAIAKYVAEREAKRIRGVADVLPHAAFDGRARECTFVGRRSVDGHALLLLRDNSKIIVLAAQEDAAALRSGDRVVISSEGAVARSQGRRR